ncbi:helix-turn-helix domain-containing protein [Mucilaginibacter jinjuensis]|uniref:Helix-turn-helix domain-containing protein n=1 Tax=Mucilaginibacter jinjuensis TaxID=1176721 RepID=A0ABY7TDU5_9SPHI|nr:helix-turn-helix domain-containing protein [Mucilaginibacter jinjuensis]WCT14196.1 helix-turn-helix domain-containing protein [Mucilaginibacter jinjuensis]
MIVEFLPYYFFAAGIIGLIVSLILLLTKNYFSQKLFLSISLISITICAFNDLCYLTGFIARIPYLYILSRAVMFLVAPCSYLYIRNSFGAIHKVKRYDLLHFIPFLLFIIIATNICLTDPNGCMKVIMNRDNNGVASFNYIENLYSLNMLLWLFYIGMQIVCILKFEQQKNKPDSYYDYKVVDWLKFLNLLLVIVFFLSMINKMHIDSNRNSDLIQGFTLSFMLLVAAFYLLSNPVILYNINQSSGTTQSIEKAHIQYKDEEVPCVTQLFGDKQKEKYLQVLNELFTQQKPFLKKGFTIKDLSQLTSIPTHHLSYLINHEFNLPFQDFINLKRIEYMKTNITSAEWEKLSLEGIAWEVGFNSRTTFFRSFVKLTGISPSEYMQSLESQNKNVSA